ncbi:MAG: hypothetical protein ACON4R_00045 [Akkermansiaceae bacterium]
MSLLIALHSPVFGYCSLSEVHFFGSHSHDEIHHDHFHDDHHECDPVQDPDDHDHLMVTLDAGEFQWAAPDFTMVPHFVVIEVPDWEVLMPLIESDSDLEWTAKNPPPPDVPIFRRDSRLRL